MSSDEKKSDWHRAADEILKSTLEIKLPAVAVLPTDGDIERGAFKHFRELNKQGRGTELIARSWDFEAGAKWCRENTKTVTVREAVGPLESSLKFAVTTLEHAIELGYLGEGSTKGMAERALADARAALTEFEQKWGKV